MPNYKVKCGDGSDNHCQGTVLVYINVSDLDKEQLEDIVESGYTEITKEQVEKSGIKLNEEEKEILEEEGSVGYEVRIDNICSACGSDQTYDDEGNNISSH